VSDGLLVSLQEMPMSYKSARLIHTAVASCSTRKLAPMPFLFPNINNYKHHIMATTKNNTTPKRTERLEVRVTSDEYNRVAELANTCGLTVSNYVRKCVLGQHPKQRLTDREIEALCSLSDVKPLGIVLFIHMFHHSQQNGSAVCVGESGIGVPK